MDPFLPLVCSSLLSFRKWFYDLLIGKYLFFLQITTYPPIASICEKDQKGTFNPPSHLSTLPIAIVRWINLTVWFLQVIWPNLRPVRYEVLHINRVRSKTGPCGLLEYTQTHCVDCKSTCAWTSQGNLDLRLYLVLHKTSISGRLLLLGTGA